MCQEDAQFFYAKKKYGLGRNYKNWQPYSLTLAVAAVIKKVVKFEVRNQGRECQTRREITYDEYLQILNILRHSTIPVLCSNKMERYRMSSILTLQWHIIARIDDMMKIQFRNITASTVYKNILMIQIRWSKNITEERDAPTQFILGSMDEHLCPLLNLAVYLECMGNRDGNDNTPDNFLYGDGCDGHRKVRAILEELFCKSH